MLGVECINNKGLEGGLTLGKQYNILQDEDDRITVKNDIGNEIAYKSSNFKYCIIKEKKC